MSKTKTIRFSEVPYGTFFSPAIGDAGSQFVYRKHRKDAITGYGVCPKLGAKEEDGIFYPNDRVVLVNLRTH